jgi:GT2 family glycosyltransferase
MAFAGDQAALAGAWAALDRLVLTGGDEVVLADNTGAAAGAARAVDARGRRAAGYARNRGAAATGAEWLVFIDADTRPVPDLLDRYFAPVPAEATGVLGGGITDVPGGPSIAARHAARRGQMSEQATLGRPGRPYAQSANMAVRRVAFDAVGGFDETARAGEDADLCWRLAGAGWALEQRPAATAEHLTRPTARALLGQLAGHGAGAAWLELRHPGAFPAPSASSVARRVTRELIRGRLLDAAEALAFEAGRRWGCNEARPS